MGTLLVTASIDTTDWLAMLASSAVDREIIGVVLVSVLASSVVDRGIIGGVLVSVHALDDRGFTIYLTRVW